jgi:thiamine-monophosphate kinase
MGLLIEKTQWCLCGGEDFELILSLPEGWARALIQASPICQKIGVMVEKRESSSSCVSWLDNDEEINGSQFIHFRKSNQKI